MGREAKKERRGGNGNGNGQEAYEPPAPALEPADEAAEPEAQPAAPVAPPIDYTIVVTLKEPPAGVYLRDRLSEVRALSNRQALALNMLYHGQLGQPIGDTGHPVQTYEHAIKRVLTLLADAAGLV